jgi:hypothetical protein
LSLFLLLNRINFSLLLLHSQDFRFKNYYQKSKDVIFYWGSFHKRAFS